MQDSDLLRVRELLEPLREIEMEVIGCAMQCCGNVTDGGECRSYCVQQGEPEYEARLVHGPINEALAILDQQAAPVIELEPNAHLFCAEAAEQYYTPLAAPDPIEACVRRNKEIEHVTLAALREKVNKMKRDEPETGFTWLQSDEAHNAALFAVIAEIDKMMGGV